MDGGWLQSAEVDFARLTQPSPVRIWVLPKTIQIRVFEHRVKCSQVSGRHWNPKNCHNTLSLNLPNVEFDFDVTVDIMQVLTDTLKSNLMLKWGLIIACKWVIDVRYQHTFWAGGTVMPKTLHCSRFQRLVFSVIEANDPKIHSTRPEINTLIASG